MKNHNDSERIDEKIIKSFYHGVYRAGETVNPELLVVLLQFTGAPPGRHVDRHVPLLHTLFIASTVFAT